MVIFTLPVSRQWFTIALWPWILSWIIEGNFRHKINRDRLSENKYALIFLSGLYLLNILSLIWTNNMNTGLNHIGIQASLLIFPLVLGFSNKKVFEKNGIRLIFTFFISGVVFISLYHLLNSTIRSLSFDQGGIHYDPFIAQYDNIFYYSNLSSLIHPTYFGMMVLFAATICFIGRQILCKNQKFHYLMIITGIFLMIMIYFISSRAVMLSAIVFLIWFLFKIVYKKKVIFYSSMLALIIIISITLAHPRFNYLVEEYNKSGTTAYEALNERVIIWESSYDIIKNNLLTGVGAGDVEDELEKEYIKKGHNFKTVFNAHNQYIEQWLTGGFFSLLILVTGLIVPLLSKNLAYRHIYISFLIICAVTFLFESTLRRFWGVAFFSIFYTLLTRRESRQEEAPGSDGG